MSGEEIFRRAICLMAENDDTTGETNTADTQEYRLRAVPLLNTLLGEVVSVAVPAQEGGCSVLPSLTAPEEDVPLDDLLCGTVLPYGLAAQLYLGEDATLSAFFHRRYRELLLQCRTRCAESEPITDVFPCPAEYNAMAAW